MLLFSVSTLFQRSGNGNIGVSVNALEHPWLVLIIYTDSNRTCAGTVITDRHVLTARMCVDAEGPDKRSSKVIPADSLTVLLSKPECVLRNSERILQLYRRRYLGLDP